MNKKIIFLAYCFFFFQVSNTIGQNLVLNPEFEENGGSLQNWEHTDWDAGANKGTTVFNDNGDHYAYLFGDNGVIYQKITNFTPGVPYLCTMNFKSVSLKQTTGYGYAIEKQVPLTVPTFTIGATNLRDFCNNNNGLWTQMDGVVGKEESNGSITYSYTIVIPTDAKAFYIGIGTKGAIAKLEVNKVSLVKNSNTKDVTFFVKNNNNEPIEKAAIEIESVAEPIITNAAGQAIVTLLQNKDYNLTVQKDYYQFYSSTLSISESTTTINISLQDLVEVKNVQTRISTYGDNNTPYPIYAHLWNSGMNFSSEINKKITSNFDYIIGGGDINGVTNNQSTNFNASNLHSEDPNFQIINYQGGWSEKASSLSDKKIDLLYYRCGNLNTSIGKTDLTFIINSPSDNRGLGLIASEQGNYTTWIRIDNELMKIVSVSSKSNYPITVTVERGLDGSIPETHNSNSTVTAPLYTVAPIPNGSNSNLSLFNPVFGPRKESLKQNAINYARNYKHDGIWIDILVGLLGGQNMTGGNYTLWDHQKNQVLSSQDINLKTKDAVKDIYEGFYAKLGYYPTIYGNNVLYDQGYSTSSRGFVMEKTSEHPRGLDGFCHENSWGHMSDDSGAIDNDGNPVSTNDIFRVASKYGNGRFLEWYMGNTWISNCKAIALLAQKELPNQPMTINAGFKNQWFAYDLTNEVRYNFNKYCYASYLLSVHVNENKKIASRMGISPMVDNGNGNLDIIVEPFFTYDIGVPTETNSSTNFTNYRVGNNNLYARKFEKGLVLVNPFNEDMSQNVSIASIVGNVKGVFLNPEKNNEVVTSIKLASRESLILVFSEVISTDDDNDGVNNDKDECPNTPNGSVVDAKGCEIFSLPTSNFTISTTGETCQGKNNGKIAISAVATYAYSVKINDKSYSFINNSLLVENLKPGTYNICISIVEKSYEQCFVVLIEAGQVISAKSSITGSKLSIAVEKGTAPFGVFVNNDLIFETSSPYFSVDTKLGDVVQVKTTVSCEGIFAEKIQTTEELVVYPNPTSQFLTIKLPKDIEFNSSQLTVELYNQLGVNINIKSTVTNGTTKINVANLSAGIYFIKINGVEDIQKFIKY